LKTTRRQVWEHAGGVRQVRREDDDAIVAVALMSFSTTYRLPVWSKVTRRAMHNVFAAALPPRLHRLVLFTCPSTMSM
jgi:hypothetical protein